MSSILNILGMNRTMVLKEQLVEEFFSNVKPTGKRPSIHYWTVYRKAQGRKKEKFVANLYCSKSEMAEKWNKFYRTGEYRLKHQLKYPSRDE
jgi:hypothetical protein